MSEPVSRQIEPDAPHGDDLSRSGSYLRRRVVLGVYWSLLFTLTHWPRLLQNDDPPLAMTDLRVLLHWDKPVHAAAFGLLNLLLIRARVFGRGRASQTNAALSTALALLYAGIDESSQALAIERSVAAGDMLANGMGVLLVYLAVVGSPRLCRLRPAAKGWAWGLAGVCLIACAGLSVFRLSGPAALPLAGLMSLLATGQFYIALTHGVGGRYARWLGLLVSVCSVIGLGLVTEALRMLAGHPAGFDYLFAHHLGIGYLILALAVFTRLPAGGLLPPACGEQAEVADKQV